MIIFKAEGGIRDAHYLLEFGSVLFRSKEIYPYLRLFVRVEVDRPRFASQTKDELTEVFNEKGQSVDYKIFNSRSKKEKDEWTRNLDASVKKILKIRSASCT